MLQTEHVDQSPKGYVFVYSLILCIFLWYYYFSYVLGIATNHQDPTTVYRDLNTTTLHTLRFIMHTLMYTHVCMISNEDRIQRISHLLRQHPQSVVQFLSEHLRVNWSTLRHLLACNDDDLSALIHSLMAEYLYFLLCIRFCYLMMFRYTKVAQVYPQFNLNSFGKSERHEFERFMTAMCNSIFENRHTRLQNLYLFTIYLFIYYFDGCNVPRNPK